MFLLQPVFQVLNVVLDQIYEAYNAEDMFLCGFFGLSNADMNKSENVRLVSFKTNMFKTKALRCSLFADITGGRR